MMGERIDDPHGVEGTPGSSAGLGLLAMHTELTQEKRLLQVSGHCNFDNFGNFGNFGQDTASVRGYEIHMGVSHGAALERPAFVIEGRGEGAQSADGQLLGSYLHGMFDHPQALAALLAWAGLKDAAALDLDALREASLERLAEATRPLYDALRGLSTRFGRD